LRGDKSAAGQFAHQRLVDRRAGEFKIVNVLGQRQFRRGDLISDGSRLLLGDLGAQQIADDPRRLMLAFDAGCHHLIISGAHAVQFELRPQGKNLRSFHQIFLRKLS
jgi:hypothetical protein